MPGEGLEPSCPDGTPAFKAGASDRFRHPGAAGPVYGADGARDAGRYLPGSIELGEKRSGPLNWKASKNAANASSSNDVQSAR